MIKKAIILLWLAGFIFCYEIELDIKSGWNMISIPCNTDIDLDSLFTDMLAYAAYNSYTETYVSDSIDIEPTDGIWVLSPYDTVIYIECTCDDISLGICTPGIPVVIGGVTVPESLITRNESGCVTHLSVAELRFPYGNALDGIEEYSNTLTSIIMHSNSISSLDLSPLAHCSKLNTVNISGNPFTHIDLTPLSSLSNLTYLTMIGNGLVEIDLTALSTLDNLRYICLNANNFSEIDLAPLESCDNINDIVLEYLIMENIDLTPLSDCVNLRTLSVCFNNLTEIDLSPLSHCHDLQTLYLHRNQLAEIDLSPLDSLLSLDHLYLTNNEFTPEACEHIFGFESSHTYIDELYHDCE